MRITIPRARIRHAQAMLARLAPDEETWSLFRDLLSAMESAALTEQGVRAEFTPVAEERSDGTLLTTKDVADRCRVAERTVRSWCTTGRIHAFQVGRNWRIPAAQFDFPPDAIRKLHTTVVEINSRFSEPPPDDYER